MIDQLRREASRIGGGLSRRGRGAVARGRRTGEILRAVGRSAEPSELPGLARRAAHLVGTRRFALDEAYVLGLLDPGLSNGRIAAAVSKRELIAEQARLNPNELWYLTEDKAVFYRYAEAIGVPVPKLYAILCQSGPGWSHDGGVIADTADWERLFEERLPDTFVVKPARGYYGLEVDVIERRDGVLHRVGRGSTTAAELCRGLLASRQFHIYVVQERLENHPEMPGGRPALQTARISTLVERDGRARVIHAFFKASAAGAAVDNFRLGALGNRLIVLALEDGSFQHVIALDESGVLRETDAAEAFGDAIGMPMWDRCCDLVRSIAPSFLPMRTLGWDVAVTPSGPVIVEANMWWDPVGSEASIRTALEALTRA